MSKITFRADDELVHQLEEFDASKSEVMREALREYLGEPTDRGTTREPGTGTLDDVLAERIDDLIGDRLDGALAPREPQDVNVNVTLEGDTAGAPDRRRSRQTSDVEGDAATQPSPEAGTPQQACNRCGEDLPESAVYCANCGEKATRRVFCECGDELRSDWSFCPGCGRRTSAAEVLTDT